MSNSLLAAVRNAMSFADTAEDSSIEESAQPESGANESPERAPDERTEMSNENGGRQTETAATENMISRADHEAAIEKAKADAKAENVVEGRKLERDRIKAICTSEEAATRPTLANHLAFNTDDDSDKAIATLAASPKTESSNGFVENMNAEPDADLGTGAKGKPKKSGASFSANEIYAARRKG